VPYSDFINRELILFSLADLARSLPHAVDGLKPSQRKVLHCAFKRRLESDVKVAQLAGYVGEHAAYHHGEAALTGTIVGLAQDFVGARNNVNLLVPSGQFGTRLAGGRDAASPRYIYTRLAPLARALFPQADDGLLEHLEEDGQRIEPRHFLPVLPLLLLNGADGIGTGWSTAVPCFNPLDVLAAVRAALDGRAPPAMHPWYRGFTGRITPVPSDDPAAARAYAIEGTVSVVDESTVEVTELPVGVWTADYRTTLSSLVKGGVVSSFRDYSSDARVRFEVTMPAATLARATKRDGAAGLLRVLRLTSRLTTSNMHTFDAARNGVQRFSDAAAVLAAFMPVRLAAYKARKVHAVATLKARAARLAASRAFLDALSGGGVDLDGQTDAAVAAQLTAAGLPRLPREARMGAFGEEEPAAPLPSSGPLAGFEYLLDIPHAARTQERAAELAADAAATAAAAAAAEASTPEAMWRADLDAFEVAYAAAQEEAARLAEEREAAAAAAVASFAEIERARAAAAAAQP
jgi:DNA topoisomerase-2